MLKLQWKKGDNKLNILLPSDDLISIPVSCVVRNLSNQWRKKNQVVRTFPEPGEPYNPDIFPLGNWKISFPVKRTDNYKAPYFIPTDAIKKVHTWELDSNGDYDHKTDKGYGLHFSTSNTTLGCIKIENKNDLLFLVNIIQSEIRLGEACELEVIK